MVRCTSAHKLTKLIGDENKNKKTQTLFLGVCAQEDIFETSIKDN